MRRILLFVVLVGNPRITQFGLKFALGLLPGRQREAGMMSLNRRHVRSKVGIFAILAVAVLLSPQYVWAQFTTASLAGTVVDSSGAGIPEAAVSVLNVATGFAQDLRTNS